MSLDLSKAKRIEYRVSAKGARYSIYYFDCFNCGTEISSQHSYAKKHSGKCNSCAHKSVRPFQSAYTQLLGNVRRGKTVDLTYEQFAELCKITTCHYCSKTIKRSNKRNAPGYRGYFLDRKDNNLGYSQQNCVPCCWRCNQTKGNRFTYEQFWEMSEPLRKEKARSRLPDWNDLRSSFLALNEWSE